MTLVRNLFQRVGDPTDTEGFAMRLAIMILGMVLTAGTATAGPASPNPVALEASLAGQWVGSLQYRDYQSDKLVSLPVKTEFRAVPDHATILETSAFDDGPKSGTVIITTVSLFDPKSMSIHSASFRRGEVPEISASNAITTAYTDMSHWVVTYQGNGTDNDKPAEIRTTETREGAKFTSVEEYRPLSNAGDWKFRNQTILTQTPP